MTAIALTLLFKTYFNHSVMSPKDKAMNLIIIFSLFLYYRTMKYGPLDIKLLYD